VQARYETAKLTVITYDTTQNDDSVFGFGMGCRGVVRVLLEAARGNNRRRNSGCFDKSGRRIFARSPQRNTLKG